MRLADYAIMSLAATLLLILGIIFLPGELSQIASGNGYDNGCKALVSQYSCDHEQINSIFAYRSGNATYTLGNLCAAKGYTDSVSCAQSCRCETASGTQASALFETPLESYGSNPVREGTVIIDDTEDSNEV